MDISEITKVKHKKYNFDDVGNNKVCYFKFLITRILISIILVLSMGILIKIDENNVFLIEEYIFNDSIKFTKINNWYQENIGKIIPSVEDNSNLVFSGSDFKNNPYEKYLDGVKINLDKNSLITALNGGIVVFIGEKENYGYTLILQGNDGIDYWYGNIGNVSVNLYDYIEKDSLIGDSINDYIYLVLQKDGNYLNYEDIL